MAQEQNTCPVATKNFSGCGTDPLCSVQWHLDKEPDWGAAVDFDLGCGNPVVACVSGIVHRVGNPGGPMGNHAFYIDDGNYHYYHLHMQSCPENGATVKEGEQIGEVGTEGNSTGCHLHFSVVPKNNDKGTGGDLTKYDRAEDQPTYKFLVGSNLPAIDSSKIVVNGGGGSGTTVTATHNNELPTDVPSIVPEKICFVYDGKVDPSHWQPVFPIHNNNVGMVHGNVEVPKSGKLERIIFVNHSDNVVATQEIQMDLVQGDLINFDYSYSIQPYLNCSKIDYAKSKQLMHQMTEYTLDWNDGHTGTELNTNDYNHLVDGTGDGKTSYNLLSQELGTGRTVASGSSGGTGTGGSITTHGLSGVEKQVAEALAKHLDAKYRTNEVIAGIMGNIEQESSMQPAVVNSLGAAGLCQWLHDRLTNLYAFAGSNDIASISVDKQIEFAVKEMNDLLASNPLTDLSLESVVDWWGDKFEHPCTNWPCADAQRDKRVAYAKNFLGGLGKSDNKPTVEEKPETTGKITGKFIRR